MKAYLNGQCVPVEEAVVPISDRGFLYGDGLFETLLVWNGRPFAWAQHWRRWSAGLEVLGFSIPQSEGELREAAEHLLSANGVSRGVLRIQATRGTGRRGYLPRECGHPTVVMTTHELAHDPKEGPASWRVHVSQLRLCTQPGHASLKSSNKLLSILARREAAALGADEALLLNQHGRVAEATGANVFWMRSGRILTPPLTEGGLEGVTRELTLNVLLPALGMSAGEAVASPGDLKAAEGVFLTLSTMGVVGVSSLDGQSLAGVELVRALHQAYWAHVEDQTRAG